MKFVFDAYRQGYANLWAKAALLPNMRDAILKAATTISSGEQRQQYDAASAASGVPTGLIAALNYRESGGLLTRYLGNGDPLSRTTTHVPAGRGPFSTWQDGAIDALKQLATPDYDGWSIEYALFFAENFNGRGYQSHDENSPYVWAGTTLEQHGMFTADHAFDATAWDTRAGVAALFKAYETVDPTLCLKSVLTAKEKPMATTTTPTTPDPFPFIIEALNIAKMFLPMLAPVIGPAPEAIIQIAVPALEDAIQFIEKARTSGVAQADVGGFIQKIAADIHAIGQTLNPVKT